MHRRLKAIAGKLWPELETLSGPGYASGLFDVTGFLYTAPLALMGLGWLIAVTDLALMRTEWPVLSVLFVLLFVFERLGFYFFVEIVPGTYSDGQASLTSGITWSAALIFGSSALWLAGLYGFSYYTGRWWKHSSTSRRWNCARNYAFNLMEILTSLIALTLYTRWAGSSTPGSAFPLPGLAFDGIVPAFFATFVWWLLPALIWAPILIWSERFRPAALAAGSQGAYIKFWGGALGCPILAAPFAVLAAGLYAQNGVGGYLFFVSGLLVASLLAHHLSQAAERSRQRSRELERLELLGRAILRAPPDVSTLSDVLKEHVSGLFPFSLIEIHIEREPLLPAQTLLRHLAPGPLVPHDRLPVGAST